MMMLILTKRTTGKGHAIPLCFLLSAEWFAILGKVHRNVTVWFLSFWSRFGIVVEFLPPAAIGTKLKVRCTNSECHATIQIQKLVLLDLVHHLSRMCASTRGQGHVLLNCYGLRDGDEQTIDIPDGHITVVDCARCQRGTAIGCSATTLQSFLCSGLPPTLHHQLMPRVRLLITFSPPGSGWLSFKSTWRDSVQHANHRKHVERSCIWVCERNFCDVLYFLRQ